MSTLMQLDFDQPYQLIGPSDVTLALVGQITVGPVAGTLESYTAGMTGIELCSADICKKSPFERTDIGYGVLQVDAGEIFSVHQGFFQIVYVPEGRIADDSGHPCAVFHSCGVPLNEIPQGWSVTEYVNLDNLPAGFSVVAVPEPATWVLMLFGFAFMGYRSLFRNQKSRHSTYHRRPCHPR